MTKHISRPHCGRDAEDGNLKGIWALILALAALLVFAPVARADVEGGTHPYRDVGSPEVTPSDDDSDDDGDDDDEDDGDDGPSGDDGDDEDEGPDDDESSDDDEDEDDDGSDDDEGSTDDDDESGNPTDNPQQPGPTTAGASGGMGSWLWPLLIALAGILAGTAVVLRQRRNRNG